MNGLVFLFDVDNTLLDNDRVKADMAVGIERLAGPEHGARFWALYEAVRRELDYVDLLRTLARFWAAEPETRYYPRVAALVLGFPFEHYVFPGALEAVLHLKTMGPAVVVSDGDPVYQPAKIVRAGVAGAVDENVLIYVHKEAHLDEVAARFPAERYVLVDDNPRILAAAKTGLGERLVTVQVCQGHYAHAEARQAYPAADVTLAAIGDLRGLGRDAFRGLER